MPLILYGSLRRSFHPLVTREFRNICKHLIKFIEKFRSFVLFHRHLSILLRISYSVRHLPF